MEAIRFQRNFCFYKVSKFIKMPSEKRSLLFLQNARCEKLKAIRILSKS